MKLVFFHGAGLGATLIRWHSRSRWNHVGVWDEETLTLYEAREWRGVVATPDWWPSPGQDVCEVSPALTDAERLEVRAWLNEQVGKRYDYAEVAKFISRRKANEKAADRRWFCSELAAEAFRRAGRELLRLPGWKISPGMLHASPLLSSCVPRLTFAA